jgi:protocatechuate 3,4-dioxygenase beta subunit
MVSTTETDGMHARENRHRTPEQILGPYFPMEHTPVPQADLTSVNGVDGFAQGEIIEVTGRILNLAGEPVRSVPVTIWQANTFGRYDHGNDPNPAAGPQLRRLRRRSIR